MTQPTETNPPTDEPNTNPVTPTVTVTPSQSAPNPGTPAAPSPGNTGPGLDVLVTAIAALPEQIVRSLKEATQPAQQPAQQPVSTGTGQSAGQAAAVAKTDTDGSEPGSKSFRDWWFGK
jgi:hypothetical protein